MPAVAASLPSDAFRASDLITFEEPSLWLGNPPWSWLVAVAAGLGILLCFLAIRRLLIDRVKQSKQVAPLKVGGLLLSLLRDLRLWSVLALAVYIAATTLILPPSVIKVLKIVAVSAIGLQALLTSRLVVDFLINQLLQRRRGPDSAPDSALASATAIIRFVSMLTLGAMTLLLVLANLDVEITPLITGLGIGGVAVALASQSILSDLFGSLSILLDKPFLVGDFIVVGDHSGTVEHIGIKTTRIRSLSGEQLVLTNSDLLSSRIRNYKRMQERRASFSFGVVFSTSVQTLERIPEIIRQIVEAQPMARFDRAHFKNIGEYALAFEVVYYVLAPEYLLLMNTQQAVNLEVMRRFAAEGIEFAYPTAVQIQREGG
jgi:small-conductance mechanosensitive channel